MLEQLILIAHVLLSVAIIGLILLQHGKGADAGASFGGGASQTVFGSAGSGNFLSRSTAILAALFFVSSFGLTIVAKDKITGGTVNLEDFAEQTEVLQVPTEDGEVPVVDDEAVDAGEEVPMLDEADMPADDDMPIVNEVPEEDLPEVDTDSATDELPAEAPKQ